MKIDFQDYENSKRIFKKAYKHPEGKKLEFRRLSEDFSFVVDGTCFVIKKGFWWDGASIPKIFWSVIGDPWEADIAPGALIHDILYGTQYYNRKKTDQILYEVNKINGMNSVKNYAVYNGVRMGGWKAWNEKTEEVIAGNSRHLFINGKEYIPLI